MKFKVTKTEIVILIQFSFFLIGALNAFDFNHSLSF